MLIKNFTIVVILSICVLVFINKAFADDFFESKIKPYIEEDFKQNKVEISFDEKIRVERELVAITLVKIGEIDKQTAYAVSIDFSETQILTEENKFKKNFMYCANITKHIIFFNNEGNVAFYQEVKDNVQPVFCGQRLTL